MNQRGAGVYLLEARLVVCTLSYTTAGVGIDSGPVFFAEPNAPPNAIGEVVREALAASKNGVAHPSSQLEWERVANVLPDALGFKSERALMDREPRYCSVYQNDDIIIITPSKVSEDEEGFDHLPDSKLTLPANTSLGAIGEAILEALRRSQ